MPWVQGKRRSELLDKVLAMFPPRLHRWLLSKWSEPAAWHNARLAFTRTNAVWSMVCCDPSYSHTCPKSEISPQAVLAAIQHFVRRPLCLPLPLTCKPTILHDAVCLLSVLE